MSYKERGSTFGHEGKEYDLNKIFDYVETMPVIPININLLDWVLKYTSISKKRIKSSDTSVPIIVTRYGEEWVIVDGVHRLSKLKKNGYKIAAAKIIPWEFLSIWEI